LQNIGNTIKFISLKEKNTLVVRVDRKSLVLGGRFGGLTVAYNLKRLVGDLADIKLVDRNRVTHFRPGIPHIALGIRDPHEIEVDLARELPRKGISFEQALVREIEPSSNTVTIEKLMARL
jgi:NADH dehydrogenase, FAD-containing subunit